MTCTYCHKRDATPGYKRCDVCRERQRKAQRATYNRWHRNPAPTIRDRAVRVLETLILAPTELAAVLDITPSHAAVTLQRLYQRGRCVRFVSGKLSSGKPKLRYRLRDT